MLGNKASPSVNDAAIVRHAIIYTLLSNYRTIDLLYCLRYYQDIYLYLELQTNIRHCV